MALMSRGVVLCVVWVGLAACSPDLNWRDVRSDDGRLVHWFPCRPVQQVRTLPLAGRDRRVELRVCDAAGASWAQMRVELERPDEADAVGQVLLQASAAKLGTVAAVRPVSLAGASQTPGPARATLQGRGPDGRQLRAGVLVFGVGGAVYQLTALGEALTEESIETFMASVRVMP